MFFRDEIFGRVYEYVMYFLAWYVFIEREFGVEAFREDWRWSVLLRNPDFTSAIRLARAINGAFDEQIAIAEPSDITLVIREHDA